KREGRVAVELDIHKVRNAECGMRNRRESFDAVFRPPHSLGFLHEPLQCYEIHEEHHPSPAFDKHFVKLPSDRLPPPFVIDVPDLADVIDGMQLASRIPDTIW